MAYSPPRGASPSFLFRRDAVKPGSAGNNVHSKYRSNAVVKQSEFYKRVEAKMETAHAEGVVDVCFRIGLN